MTNVTFSFKGLASFPNPVNEKAARVVAGLVVASVATILLTGRHELLWLVAVGFALRVLAGPRFSPFGQLATRVIAPRLGRATLVPGPPKRFAQGMGLVMSTAAATSFAVGADAAGYALAAVLIIAATLESVAAVCLGCITFGWLQRAGVIPESVCEACANFSVGGPSRVVG